MGSASNWTRRRFLRLTGMASLALGACAVRAPASDDVGPTLPGSTLDQAARERPVAFLDRLTWGATLGDLDALRRLGGGAYLHAQLHPCPSRRHHPTWLHKSKP